MKNMQELKAQLTSMYPGYRFEIKPNAATLAYNILVFKERKTLDILSISSGTPMNEVWDKIIAWMKTVLRK